MKRVLTFERMNNTPIISAINRRILLALVGIWTTLSITAQTLPTLRITIPTTVNSEYQQGTMSLTDENGKTVSLNAKFKTRGATAKQYTAKPSMNMKLRTVDYSEELDSTLLDIRSASSWILDAMATDVICMRNRVSFDLWNEMSRLPYDTDFGGRNGTIGKFVELYMNDSYYGIYCLSDRINRKLLDLKKSKENKDGSITYRGLLYKNGTEDIKDANGKQESACYSSDYLAAIIDYHNALELTYPEEKVDASAWSPLQEAFANMTQAYAQKYFHADNIADYQLLVMALSLQDNWGLKNRYFSIQNVEKNIDDADATEAAKRKIVITPWDLDCSFGGDYRGSRYNGNYAVWQPQDVSNSAAFPFAQFLQDDNYKALLKQKWQQAANGVLSVKNVEKKLRAYQDLFLQSGAWQRQAERFDHAHNDPKSSNITDLKAEIDQIVKWYEARVIAMDNYFGTTSLGIHELTAEEGATDNSKTYNLAGQAIDTNQLTHGLYIQKGKKYIVR